MGCKMLRSPVQRRAARLVAPHRAGGLQMKVSRLLSAVFVVVALGVASLSLSACQSTGDMSSSGASSSGTSGSGGGY
jgi:hypothetical protein